MTINIHSKSQVSDWVNGTAISAGEKLGHRRDADQYQAAHTPTLVDRFPNIHYVDNSWNWGGNTSHNYGAYVPHMFQPARTEEQEERQEERKDAKWAVIAGSIALLAGAFIAGLTNGKRSAYAAVFEITKDIQTRAAHMPGEIYATLSRLAGVQLRIDTRNHDKINNYFFSAIGIVLGGVSMLGGGLTKNTTLIALGKIAALAAAAFVLYNLGSHWSDDDLNRTDAAEVLPLAERARQQLTQCREDMQPMVPTYPQYAPTYGYSQYAAPLHEQPPAYAPMYYHVEPSAPYLDR